MQFFIIEDGSNSIYYFTNDTANEKNYKYLLIHNSDTYLFLMLMNISYLRNSHFLKFFEDCT